MTRCAPCEVISASKTKSTKFPIRTMRLYNPLKTNKLQGVERSLNFFAFRGKPDRRVHAKLKNPNLQTFMTEASDRKIDILIDQVGRLTESVHELKLSTHELKESTHELKESTHELRMSIHELKEITIAQNQAIQRTADQHDQTVNRLIGVVETLITQGRSS